MFLDTTFNSRKTVLSTIYQNFVEASMKYYRYARCMARNKEPHLDLLIGKAFISADTTLRGDLHRFLKRQLTMDPVCRYHRRSHRSCIRPHQGQTQELPYTRLQLRSQQTPSAMVRRRVEEQLGFPITPWFPDLSIMTVILISRSHG